MFRREKKMTVESPGKVESKIANLVEPDLEFVREIKQAGGDTIKKCFQCAACSVVCALSPDEKPYPRKEMIYAQWGLKERLVNSVDVWLCHACNDCSTYCPRGARPGDALRAIRAISFRHFAFPRFMGKMVGEAKYFPVMLAIPVVLFLVLLSATGHLNIPQGEIIFSRFFPIYLVDGIFLTVTALALLSMGVGVRNFLQGMHTNSIREGYAEDRPLVMGDYVKGLISVLPTILFHNKFKLCTTNRDQYTSHLLAMFGFVGLFITTTIVFLGLVLFHSETPYSLANPVKWLANISGFGLLAGIMIMLAKRLKPKVAESTNTYPDWALIWMIVATAVSGLLAQFSRLAGDAGLSYTIYFLHLVAVFYIIAYLPYSKLAHLVYRTAAMAYAVPLLVGLWELR
jgi:quinone-modifying oxidoreductase subunit QmoC